MERIRYYERPETVEEALKLLGARRNRAVVLAGGTSLSLRLPIGVDTLIDLSRTGLKGIEDRGDATAILACTPIADLIDASPFKDSYGGLLSKAAQRISSTPLRNQITVGGNAIQVYPWSDLPPVLLALNARFVTAGPQSRELTAAEFYAAHPQKILADDEILTEIRIPKAVGRAIGSFVKVTRTKVDYATLSVTVIGWFSGKQVTDCSVAVGAVRPLPQRVPQAEEEIRGRIPTREDVIRAAARAAGAVDPSRDYRFGTEYRRHLVKVWVKRCLHEVVL
jgi:aerobic carbon-monoxide dehydrogenase medium subunit